MSFHHRPERAEQAPSRRLAARWIPATLLAFLCTLSSLQAAESATSSTETPTTTPATPVAKDALRTLDDFTGRNSLGFTLGAGSGTGLSYRRYLTDRVAIRGTGYLLYARDLVNIFSVGVNGQLDLMRDTSSLFYAVAGMGVAKAIEIAAEPEVLTLDLALFPNIGLGYERGSRTESGFVYQGELVLTVIIVDGQARVLPLPQVGIQYLF